jgi:uncharacterized membrane protein
MHWLFTWLYTKTPLVWFVESYWRDEAFSILMAQRKWTEISWLTAQDFSPPLYYYLLKVWMMLFGSSEIATRSLSLLCYVLTLFVLVEFLVFVFHFRSRDISPVMLPLGLLTPVLAYYAFETRGYTLLALCATTSTYALCTKSKKLYTLSLLAGCMTHYSMIFVFATHCLVQLFGWTPYTLKEFVKISVLPLLVTLSWMLYAVYAHQGASPASFWIPAPRLYDLINAPEILLTGREVSTKTSEYVRSLTTFVYVVVLFAAFGRTSANKKATMVLIASIILPPLVIYLISTSTPISLYHPRYMIVSAPPLLLLLLTSIRRYKSLHRIMLVMWLGLLLYGHISLKIKGRHKEDLRSNIYHIQQYSSPTDYLYVPSVLDYHTAQLYWYDKDHVKIIGDTYDAIPSYVGKSLIPKDALVDGSSPCKDPCRIFVLDHSGQLKVMPKLL